MQTLVTGSAGFIGTHLVQRLVAEGHTVTGIDALTPYYDPAIKRARLQRLSSLEGFTPIEGDMRTDDLRGPLDGVEAVFHLAGQPGVRTSWGDPFDLYLGHNLLATQRLLEAVRATADPPRVVFASSSSVYGETTIHPTPETAETSPVSPYGVTKLAAERLIDAYRVNFGLEAVILRYFTVYGPGQRPDMAFTRFIDALLRGEAIQVFGDGGQTRDVTYVEDVVAATIAAGTAPSSAACAGASAINVAGGSQVSISDTIEMLADLIGVEPNIAYGEVSAGDVRATGGDITKARELLDYAPQTTIREGLTHQVSWHREHADEVSGPRP